MTERLGKPIKEKYIELALNPTNARSQDQLHIHISCLSAAANVALINIPTDKVRTAWSKSQVTIPPYHFYYRHVSMAELIHKNLFKVVAEKVRQEKGSLDYTGAALVNRSPGEFMLLVGIGTSASGVSAELIQDHQCLLAGQ